MVDKVKRLPPEVIDNIALKNHARRLAGLSPIRIKVRTCVRCGGYFESAGNRTCDLDCKPPITGKDRNGAK